MESNSKNIFPNVIINGKEITLHFIHKDEDINIPKNIKQILLNIGEPASTEPSTTLEESEEQNFENKSEIKFL